MKKFIVILLTVALLLCGAFLTYALAEAPAVPAAGPTVDLTGLVIAVLLAAFEFLMARFARVLIPPAKAWLEAHTTEKERGLLWNAVCELVDAAEQIIKGPAMGERRKAYVEAGLRQRGLSVDSDMIEAAVKRMNDGFMSTMATAFKVTTDIKDAVPVPVDENGEPDLEITHWNVDQLRSFCKLNNIPAEGCVSKEEFMWAIEKGSVTGEEPAQQPQEAAYDDCKAKDYCELDENGNAIQEAPQSVNE